MVEAVVVEAVAEVFEVCMEVSDVAWHQQALPAQLRHFAACCAGRRPHSHVVEVLATLPPRPLSAQAARREPVELYRSPSQVGAEVWDPRKSLALSCQ